MTLAEAYAECERLARAHYENFPVASSLLPRRLRPHVAAVYAFARTADDFADEGDAPAGERQRRLDDWIAQLHDALTNPAGPERAARANRGESRLPRASRAAGRVEGNPACPERAALPGESRGTPPAPSEPRCRASRGEPRLPRASRAAGRVEGNPEPRIPILAAVADTIRRFDLPKALFEDLISAFRQDVTTTRYESWTDVLDYCRRSANPVGRIVLRLAGYRDAGLDRASDHVCTALQLTNFWQDLERDWRKGRLYVPREDLARLGAREADLDRQPLSPAWRGVLSEMAQRTRALFEEGRPVCDGVSGRLRLELRFTWLGGCRILDKLEHCGFDVFTGRPTLGAADVPVLAWRAAIWRPARPTGG